MNQRFQDTLQVQQTANHCCVQVRNVAEISINVTACISEIHSRTWLSPFLYSRVQSSRTILGFSIFLSKKISNIVYTHMYMHSVHVCIVVTVIHLPYEINDVTVTHRNILNINYCIPSHLCMSHILIQHYSRKDTRLFQGTSRNLVARLSKLMEYSGSGTVPAYQ